jgi:hypothetical protein
MMNTLKTKNMNKFINHIASILFVLITNFANAQDFVIPEKYKKESVVMTYINIEEIYNVYGTKPSKRATFNNVTTKEFEVYLADRSAVQEYESFYFKDEKTLELKIIKKDGKEVKVDLSEAVEVGSSIEIPLLMRRSIAVLSIPDVRKKIALSNLEIGDRLYFKQTLKNEKDIINVSEFFKMDSYDKYLQENFPVLKKTITIKADQQLYFNYNLYNAGNVKPEISTDNNYMVFTLELKDLDPFKSESYVYKEHVYPTLKYDVMFVHPKSVDKTYQNINQPGEVNFGYDEQRLINYAHTLFQNNKKITKKGLKAEKLYKLNGPVDKYIENLYNTLASGDNPGRSDMKYQSRVDFIAYFSNAFVKNKIDFEIGFAYTRPKGNIKHALWHHEFEPYFLVKDNSGNEYYVFNPNKYQQWNSMEISLDDCESYLISFDKKRDLMSLREHRLPKLSPETNRLKFDIKAVIGDSCTSIKIEEKQTAVGYFKHTRLNNGVISYKKSLEEIDEIMDKANLSNEGNSIFINNQKVLELLIEDSRTSRVENKHYNYKYESFDLLEKGDENDQDEHVYVDKYELLDYPTPIGGNFYTIKLNRIMPSFTTIDPEELLEERSSPIFLHLKSNVQYSITLKTPKGFDFLNPEDFNLDIKHDFSNFKSIMEKAGDNEYTLNITYEYPVNEIPSSQWNDYVKMRQAIYDLSLQKIVLKKTLEKM